jgi:hypothetical protein
MDCSGREKKDGFWGSKPGIMEQKKRAKHPYSR